MQRGADGLPVVAWPRLLRLWATMDGPLAVGDGWFAVGGVAGLHGLTPMRHPPVLGAQLALAEAAAERTLTPYGRPIYLHIAAADTHNRTRTRTRTHARTHTAVGLQSSVGWSVTAFSCKSHSNEIYIRAQVCRGHSMRCCLQGVPRPSMGLPGSTGTRTRSPLAVMLATLAAPVRPQHPFQSQHTDATRVLDV